MKAKFLYGPVDGAEFDSEIVLESNGRPKPEIIFPRRTKISVNIGMEAVDLHATYDKYVYTLFAYKDAVLYYKYARTI